MFTHEVYTFSHTDLSEMISDLDRELFSKRNTITSSKDEFLSYYTTTEEFLASLIADELKLYVNLFHQESEDSEIFVQIFPFDDGTKDDGTPKLKENWFENLKDVAKRIKK